MTDTSADLAVRLLVENERELGEEERRVLENIAAGRLTSRDAADVSDERSSFGERLSDRVAAVGGSWSFIIFFGLVLLGWMLLNTDILAHFGKQFDPYPYIFLNLLLSTLAAIQAPVIMMSQNRQAAKDRVAARLDYETNLRSELDILRLHEKIDRHVDMRLADIARQLAIIAAAVEKRGAAD